MRVPESFVPALLAGLVLGAAAFATGPDDQDPEPPARPATRAETRPGSRPGSEPGGKPRPVPEVLDLGTCSLRPHPEWRLREPDSSMRKAVLVLPAPREALEPAELIVYHFGAGGAGSAEANLARWKQMFARPAERPPEEFARRHDHVVRGIEVTAVEVRGTYLGPSFRRLDEPRPDHMMLAAHLATAGGAHYLRALGPEETLTHWKPAWRKLIASLEPAGGSEEPDPDESGAPDRRGSGPPDLDGDA